MRSIDLTQGSIVKGVVAFALPLLGTSVVQQLYPTVDLLFVGNVLGTRAVAALGVGSLLITLLVGAFTGISVGVNVKVANLCGAGDARKLERLLATTVTLALVSGIALAALGFALAQPFVDVMDVPAESAGDAFDYLRFAVAAAFPIGVYNICAGALRGLGDSRSPLLAQGAGGLANIVANWFALCVMSWGIVGCAVATLLSNSLAAALVAAFLVRDDAFPKSARRGSAVAAPPARDGAFPKGVRRGSAVAAPPARDGAFPKDVRRGLPALRSGADASLAKEVLVFGLPIAVQTIAITVSNVAVQHQIDLLGVDAIAAFVVYLKVELPIYFVILALGQTTTTFVAQNYGAGLYARCSQGTRICLAWCMALAACMSAIMLGCGYWAFWLFDHNEAVIALGLAFIWTTFPFYFVYAVLEVQADAMRGFGHSLGPALVVLANICILRVILVFTFTAQGWGLEAIAATYPITWTTTALCMLVLRAVLNRTRKARKPSS